MAPSSQPDRHQCERHQAERTASPIQPPSPRTVTPTLWTVARIAEHLGVPRHRVEYVIDTRGIRPIGTAGIARVFDGSDVTLIASALARIEAEREGGDGGEPGEGASHA